MPEKTEYKLTRRLPDGTEKVHSVRFATKRKAAQAAFFSLLDNGAAGKPDANAFASRLQDAPLGAWLEHASGYAFTVTAWQDSGS
jgi:hypothetical protein